jgi:outer membrane protein
MRLKSVSLLLTAVSAILLVPSSAEGAETAVVERQMSLEDCITAALEQNLDIQIERYNPLIAQGNLGLAYSDYDPVLNLRASHDFNQDPGGRDEVGRQYEGRETETDALSGGLSGLLPSGLTYNFSASAVDTYGREPFIEQIGTNVFIGSREFETARGNLLLGEFRQPLLRNFWIDGTRLNIRLRKKDLKISDLNLRLVLINTVSAVEQAYYDLIAARENVRSAAIAFELAQKLYEENKKRVEVGAMAQLDERQAQAQMATSEAALIEAQRTANFTENILKNLITDNYLDIHNVRIVPSETLTALPRDFDVEEAWNRAFELRPDLHTLLLDLERRDLITRYQRNQLFPQLDVFGSVGWQGTGPEIGDALAQVREQSAPRHGYGALLSFPLSNRRARENYRISKDERAQAELRLRQFRQQIMVGIHDAIQQAESSFQRVGATRAARQFAEEALAAEEKKLANGKSTSFEVLRLQRDLTQARFDETRALADYNKALATLRQREGTTLLKFDLERPTLPAQTDGAQAR